MEIIREDLYQRSKELMNKEKDYFYDYELERFGKEFNAIFNATTKIFTNIVEY